MDLDERKYKILQAIIDDYITTAMPVGSRTISRKQGMGLSSATIRNEMSDLEELGYLASPHTSAGRIPSYRAYRLYVDQIMRVGSLPPTEYSLLRKLFSRRMGQMEDVLTSATQALSELTDYTSVMIAPLLKNHCFSRIHCRKVDGYRPEIITSASPIIFGSAVVLPLLMI